MSTPHLFRFFIQDSAGNNYYVGDDGQVSTTSDSKPLRNSPRNWQNVRRKYGRNPQLWGIFRSTSTPLEFCLDGAKILRYIYYKDNGINYNAYARLVIEKRNDSGQNVWAYQNWFNTEVDFANQPDDGVDEKGNFFKVSLVDRGFQQTILNAMDKDIEIPLDDDADTVTITGFPIRGQYQWRAGDFGTATSIVSGGTGGSSQYYIFPMGLVEETNTYFKKLFFAQQQGAQVDVLNDAPLDSNRIIAVTADQSFVTGYTLTGTVDVDNVGGATNLRLQVYILEKNMLTNSNNFAAMLFQSGSDIVGSQTVTINTSGNFTFDDPNLSYYLVIRAGATSVASVDITVREIVFTIQFNKSIDATPCKALRYSAFTQAALNEATEAMPVLMSGLLTTFPANTHTSFYANSSCVNEYVTSGDAIRGITNPVIKTKLSDIMKDLWARWMAGLSTFAGVARIERIDYFLNSGVVIDTFPTISNLKKTTATEFLANQIQTGYSSPSEKDNLNGKYDFAAKQTYKMDITSIQNDDDLTTPFNASPFEIERLRSNLDGQNTTSDSSDNRVFLLQAQVSGADIVMLKFDSGEVNGFLTHEIYNIGMTPHRFILRHAPRYRATLNVQSGIDGSKVLTFEQAERWATFNTFIGGFVTFEDGDISVGAPSNGYAPEKLFTPLFFSFDCYPKAGFMDLVETNPNGVINFYDEITSQWLSGFIWDIEISPNEEDKYTMTLLASNTINTNVLVY